MFHGVKNYFRPGERAEFLVDGIEPYFQARYAVPPASVVPPGKLSSVDDESAYAAGIVRPHRGPS
jgi:hypothetical protein